MNYERTHAYCLSGLKSAAVFHDKVTPTDLVMSDISKDINECVNVMASLLRLEEFPKDLNRIFAPRISKMQKWLTEGELYNGEHGYPENIPQFSSSFDNIPDKYLFTSVLSNANHMKKSLRDYLQYKDIDGIYWKLLEDVDFHGGTLNVVHGVNYESPFIESETHPSFTLSNINIVNSELLSWEQIIELRKDIESIYALRSLRLFMYEDFEGKSLAYIEDKLNHLLYLHEEKAQSWGFKTMAACIDTCVSKDNILSLGLLSTSIFGAPLEVAAAAGTATTFGKIAVTLHNRHYERKNALNFTNVKYLWDIKELTK